MLKPSPAMSLTRRYARLLFLACLLTAFLFFSHHSSPPALNDVDLVLLPPSYQQPPPRNHPPPLFEPWKEYERYLSQNTQVDDSTKFLYMKNHVFASGWGNVLQEMFLNTHLAYLSGRSFVFDNYTWDRSESEYSSFNGKTIPSRVPVSTMLSGPLIGGSFDPMYFNDPLFDVSGSHPRAVHSEYYERVCAGQNKVINTETIRDAVDSWDGLANLRAWCRTYIQYLDVRLEGDSHSLAIPLSFSHPQAILSFSVNPRAFERNRRLFGFADVHVNEEKQGFFHLLKSFFFSNLPLTEEQPPTTSVNTTSLIPLYQLPTVYPHAPANPSRNDTIPGLLVLHIRRGDFEEHCHNLAEWGSRFNGFNSFDDLREQDGFDFTKAEHPGDPPPEPVEGMPEEEGKASFEAYAAAQKDYEHRRAKYENAKAAYLLHCYPDIDQIARRVRQVREEAARSGSARLNHIYIMTNGKPPFLAQLRAALEADALNNLSDLSPWESIYTSRDLEMGWEEGYVAQALDMYVAQRAHVFIGNGFSSLTSNIVVLRKASGVEGVGTRLW
ncbi:hypothetical protein D9757_001359 [Collybiopsis confluens]|uniref:Uncharacterized protein n=1 Tax=Collybiopsis confluens TaxID=2823264 RepID=A0A8H5HZ63_9AGAR|nr:hypothetical protein D9757_001359 [Collybiopsis confluens]